MSVILNEAALHFLLESPDGPLGTRLGFVAQDIEANYNAVVDKVWELRSSDARPNVGSAVTFGESGLQAEIGLTDSATRSGGRKSTSGYMAEKFHNAAEGWAVAEIMAGWDNSL